jgi:probable rRNA maturation factor
MTEDPGSTSLNVAVVDRDPRWREDVPDAGALVRRAAGALFAHRLSLLADGMSPPLEVAVVLADDALLRTLNRDHRGQDRPTNVLSFGNPEAVVVPGQPRLLGDVVLARETVLREAAEQGKPAGHHLMHLVVHGLLHLLGYDHDETVRAAEMEALEIAVLAELGVSDPYVIGAAPREPAA